MSLMPCPQCQCPESTVIDSRQCGPNGKEVRRRRKCPKCKGRWTTYERTEADIAAKADPLGVEQMGVSELAKLMGRIAFLLSVKVDAPIPFLQAHIDENERLRSEAAATPEPAPVPPPVVEPPKRVRLARRFHKPYVHLTPEQVEDIRDTCQGRADAERFATKYGVTVATVMNAWQGRTYRKPVAFRNHPVGV